MASGRVIHGMKLDCEWWMRLTALCLIWSPAKSMPPPIMMVEKIADEILICPPAWLKYDVRDAPVRATPAGLRNSRNVERPAIAGVLRSASRVRDWQGARRYWSAVVCL